MRKRFYPQGRSRSALSGDIKLMSKPKCLGSWSAHGFTLIELLVTIAIAAILLGLAAPSFQDMVLNNRQNAEIGSLTAGLNYARSTALSQTIPVRVCPILTTSSTTCGTNWGTGWMVVLDPNGTTPSLLQSRQITSSSAVLSSTAPSIDFDARGLSTTVSKFKVCDSRGALFARAVQVFITGFVQTGNTVGKEAYAPTGLTCP
jgi:type IV fimbrial biogenesis protein FimT